VLIRIAPGLCVERPFCELLVEAVFTPVLVFLFVRAMRGGWGH
jgi:hypothetical protein